MVTEHFSRNKDGGVASTNLDAVTSATNGSALGTRDFRSKTVFVDVPVNTGAVTVNIEGSFDGSNFFNLDSKTYTAEVTSDIFSYAEHLPSMRTTTTSQSNATVTTSIAGGS